MVNQRNMVGYVDTCKVLQICFYLFLVSRKGERHRKRSKLVCAKLGLMEVTWKQKEAKANTYKSRIVP